ncbi:MAG: excinuclease ABC subunit UvrC [Thermoplasmatota archaeon]
MEISMKTDPSTLPNSCGVYLFKSGDGSVIYVGKAVDIRSRIRSHLGDRANPKEIRIQEEYREIDWITTSSELEALVLEDTLIKKYQPRYNVRLKDDKSYPYLLITRDRYPSVHQIRGLKPDMGDHFGPHGDPRGVRRSLRWLRKIFPVRSCRRDLSRPSRPCLEYHLGRCLAPCRGDVKREDYMIAVNGLKDFLSGKREKLTEKLEKDMWSSSSLEDYERAAMVRDILGGLQKMRESQKVTLIKGGEIDVISLSTDMSAASVVEVRNSRVVDVVSFSLVGSDSGLDPLREFVSSFYAISGFIPRRIVVRGLITNDEKTSALETFLSAKKGSRVNLRKPRGEEERSLAEIALRNSEDFARKKMKEVEREDALVKLKKELDLPSVPLVIEGFDVSHLSGTGTVASMVQFHRGRPRKGGYRRFRIREAKNDDYLSMKEAVRRRYAGLLDRGEPLPDLILIDGGKGQLNSAVSALSDLGIEIMPPVVSLAKKDEEIYLPGRRMPIILKRDNMALKVLQRVRDEAHRFAVSYQRRTRKPDTSILIEIDGVGKARALKILGEFNDLPSIVEAGSEEVSRRCSISPKMAREIIEFLKTHLETQ